MKRLSKKQRRKLLRRQRTHLRSRVRVSRKSNSCRSKSKKDHTIRPDHHSVNAPVIFDIGEKNNRRSLIVFLEKLRSHFKDRPEKRLFIDFQNTQHFVADGTLLFYAELCRLLHYRPTAQVRCNRPRNERAKQVLRQIGVYELCRHTYRGKPTHKDVVHWRVARGHMVDASQYAETIEAHEGRLAEPLVEGIYRGLAEAMTNVCHHAYIHRREDGLDHHGPSDWWVFSQAKDGHLFVALCDLGVGIPVTLPKTNPSMFSRLKAITGIEPLDGKCILAAVEDSRSRTGKRERGKGLGEIIRAVSGATGGRAVVFSNRGYYMLNDGKESHGNYRDNILGTLISWCVPIQAG
jgi:hypothetical protein